MRMIISELLQERLLDDMVNGHRRVPDDPAASSTSPVGISSPQAAIEARPALGFPLGTALILFVVFGVSTVFSCCYHWEKIRHHAYRFTGNPRLQSPPRSESPSDTSLDASDAGEADHRLDLNTDINWMNQSLAEKPKCSKQALSLPVMMPGDKIPRFVAWPSPMEVVSSSWSSQPRATSSGGGLGPCQQGV